MWVAKIKFSAKGTLIGSKTEKYNLNLFAFPLSFYYEGEWILVHIAGTLIGGNKDKKDFVKDLKKEKRVVNLELNSDFIIGTVKEPIYAKDIYHKDIFHLLPAFISDKGYEIITIGSFSRERLLKVFDILKRKLIL